MSKVKDVLEAGTMPFNDDNENKNGVEDETLEDDALEDQPNGEQVPKGKKKSLEELGPVALAELGSRRGSRFSADGTPLFLKAFLESANPSLHFQFCFKNIQGSKNGLAPLEEEFDRRIMGKKVRFSILELKEVDVALFSGSI